MKYKVGQKIIGIKDYETITGVVSRIIPEMQYEIAGYNGSIRSVDQAHIVSAEEGQCLEIDGESYPYNSDNNTLYFDNTWLLIEENEVGKYVVTIAGNKFYLD